MLRIFVRRILPLLCLVAACLGIIFYVSATTIAGIEVEGPSSVAFDEYNLEDYKVVVKHKNGDVKEEVALKEEYVTEGDFSNSIGNHTITVEYEGFKTEFTYNIVPADFGQVDVVVSGAELGQVNGVSTYITEYDGLNHYFDIVGIPDGTTVEYAYWQYNSEEETWVEYPTSNVNEKVAFSDIGLYKVRATYTHPSYNSENNTVYQQLEIRKKSITVNLPLTDFDYNGGYYVVDQASKPVFGNGVSISEDDYEIYFADANGNKLTELINIGEYKLIIKSRESCNFDFYKEAKVVISKKYTVTFIHATGEVETIKVKEGERIPEANIPKAKINEKEYQFVVAGGWDWATSGHNKNASVYENFVVAAPRTPIEYTITFKIFEDIDGDGVFAYNTYTITHNADMWNSGFDPFTKAPNTPDVGFAGWYLDGSLVTSIPTQYRTENIILRAMYEYKCYIDYEGNGNLVEKTIRDYEPTLKESDLTPPVKKGYQIVSWNITSITTGTVKSGKMPYHLQENGLIFTPVYGEVTYTIYFNGNKPEAEKVNLPTSLDTVDYRITIIDTIDLSAYICSLKNYVFEGWYDENGTKVVSFSDYIDGLTQCDDINLYAKWRALTVTVRFNDGTEDFEIEVPEAKLLTYNGAPFYMPTQKDLVNVVKGWQLENWLYIDPHTGEAVSLTPGELLTLPDLEKIKNDGTVEYITEIAFTASWGYQEFNIYYANAAADGYAKQLYGKHPFGTAHQIQINKMTSGWNDFTFMGWIVYSLDSNGTPDRVLLKDENGNPTLLKPGETYLLTSDVVFVSQWKTKIKLHNGNESFYYEGECAGKEIILPSCEFNIEGAPYASEYYELLGWSTNPNAKRGDRNIYAVGSKYVPSYNSGDIHAIWALVQHEVTYKYQNENGEDKTITVKVDHGTDFDLTIAAPTKIGYTFNKGNIGGVEYTSYIVLADTELDVVWSPNANTIIFKDSVGVDQIEIGKWENKYTGSKIKLNPENISKDYYEIYAWSTNKFASYEDMISGSSSFEYYMLDDDFTIPANNENEIVLYAIWKPIDYTVIFDYEDSDITDTFITIQIDKMVDGEYVISHGDMKIKDLNGIVPYIFNGWYSDSAYTSEISVITDEMLKNAENKVITLYTRAEATPGIVVRGEEIYRYNSSERDTIYLPNYYNGTRITSIGVLAFDTADMKTVVFPARNTITKIDRSAFRDCRDLEEITIPSGVVNIAEDAFKGALNVVITIEYTTTEAPNYNKYFIKYTDESTWIDYYFEEGTSIKYVSKGTEE